MPGFGLENCTKICLLERMVVPQFDHGIVDKGMDDSNTCSLALFNGAWSQFFFKLPVRTMYEKLTEGDESPVIR